MRQKNRRRSLLTLYHHHGNSKHISSVDYNHNDNHLLHSDKSTYTNTYFYKYKSKLHKLVSLRLGPQNLAHTSIPLLVSGFGLLLVLGLSVGCIGGGNSSIAYAEGEDEVSAQSNDASVSLSLADTANNGNMTITDNNKSIQEQVDTTNNTGYIAVDFHVTATNIDKYDVYVQSSNSALIGETNKGRVESISSNTAYADMSKNAGWGYAVAEGTNVNAETLTYKPIQTSASSAVDSGSATNTTVNKDYTLAFAANLTGATADHYKSDITLSVAAGAAQVTNLYSITYNTNNSTSGTTPTTQTAESNAETYTFTAPEQNDLVRTDYGLAGWSEDPNATSPEYKLGETITLNKTNPSKTLYAVWRPGLRAMNTMQEMTSVGCSSATSIGETKQLTDIRKNSDGNTRSYWVAKLADGNCWMTQNLDYDDPGGQKRTGDTKPNIWQGSSTATDGNKVREYWDPGEKIVDGETLAAANANTDKHLLVGNYYSWLSATNGTGSSITSANSSDYPVEASGSICPEGWRLPTGGDSGEFRALNNLYPKGTNTKNQGWINSNSTNRGTWFGAANEASGGAIFRASGYVYDGSFGNAGSHGYYWSSTAQNASRAYSLNFNSASVYPSGSPARSVGNPIRCVAR